MKTCVVIPARYHSTRLPGKPLALINGKPMIQLVVESTSKAVGIDDIYLATDDQRIYDLGESLGVRAIMTSTDAMTGTDRVAEAVQCLDYDVIINVQGDEPMVNPRDIQECISLKQIYFNQVINGYTYIESNEVLESLTVPKVVTNDNDELVYMSRTPIPFSKDGAIEFSYCKKQVCIYGFNKNELEWFGSQKSKSSIEAHEDIEILRFLETDKVIKMFKCSADTIAVDTEEDRLRVEAILRRNERDN